MAVAVGKRTSVRKVYLRVQKIHSDIQTQAMNKSNTVLRSVRSRPWCLVGIRTFYRSFYVVKYVVVPHTSFFIQTYIDLIQSAHARSAADPQKNPSPVRGAGNYQDTFFFLDGLIVLDFFFWKNEEKKRKVKVKRR